MKDMAPAAPAAPAVPAPAAPVETQPATAGNEVPLSAAALPDSSVVSEALEHGQHVADLVAMLFDGLSELHKLGTLWERRLRLAAQLHDIGFAEGRKGHHKVSMRIIEEDLSLNIADEDRPWVALLARYHRKAWPSCRQARFAALGRHDRRDLSKTVALLRIADALDYTHAGIVRQIEPSVRKRHVLLTLTCAGDGEAERQRALKKGDLFVHLFGKELECVCQAN